LRHGLLAHTSAVVVSVDVVTVVLVVVVVGWQPDEIHKQLYDVSYDTHRKLSLQGFEAQKFTLVVVDSMI